MSKHRHLTDREFISRLESNANDLSIVLEAQRRYTILVERCARLERENSSLKDAIAVKCPDLELAEDPGVDNLS